MDNTHGVELEKLSRQLRKYTLRTQKMVIVHMAIRMAPRL